MIVLYVILAVLVLLLMITIHEAGHYTAGKLLGFGITEFSVGLGPKLLSRRLRSGEEISLRALPLGGYCAFVGEDDQLSPGGNAVGEETKRPQAAFDEQKPWKRIVVLLMGPMFNLLSAFVFSFIYIISVGYAVPVVTELAVDLSTGEPYASELAEGDRIVAVNGKEITFLDTADELISATEDGGAATFTVERGGKLIEVTAEKSYVHNGEHMFGVTMTYESRSVDVAHAAAYSFPYTFELSWAIIRSFGLLFTGAVPLTDVTGPIGTVSAIATYAEADIRYFLLFLPLIASNLAIFNILPIPALDGARIVFAMIEWIRRKPINKKTENTIHAVGLIALLAFVVVVDITGIIARSLS